MKVNYAKLSSSEPGVGEVPKAKGSMKMSAGKLKAIQAASQSSSGLASLMKKVQKAFHAVSAFVTSVTSIFVSSANKDMKDMDVGFIQMDPLDNDDECDDDAEELSDEDLENRVRANSVNKTTVGILIDLS